MSEKKTKAERKKLKERQFEFVSNITSIAEAYNCTCEEALEKIIKQINTINYVKHYAGIVHDKDLKEDGTAKAEHVHIVLALTCPVTAQTIAGRLGMPDQTICKIYQKKQNASGKWVTDLGGALSYLTHRNAPDKYQYNDDEVFASPGWDWKKIRAKSESAQNNSNLDQIVDGIITGEIRQNDLSDHIDPYTYIQPQNKRKIDNAFEFRRNMLLKNHDRNILCMYFYGEKGTGKTTLAKWFAENNDLSYFVSGGANDPLDSYRDEDVIIIDDCRPEMFTAEEWLKLLDNNTSSLVHSRYHNKLIEAKFIILTSTIPLYNFFGTYVLEDKKQLYRRIKLWAYITKDQVELYEWNNSIEDYLLFETGTNPVYLKFKDNDTSLSETDKKIIAKSILRKEEGERK